MRAKPLFLGGVFPRDDEAAIVARSRGPIQNAANALQWTLIQGFDEALGEPITLLNAMFVGSYPRLYRDAWVRGGSWSHAPGARDQSIGFLNLFGVKHVWRTVALAWAARRWASSARGSARRCIVVYSMHAPFLVAAAAAKRVDPSLKICLIVPDLPEHMNLSGQRGAALRLLKVLDRKVMDAVMGSVDCFVTLTRFMAEPLGVGTRPWIVMEGAVNPGDACEGASAPGSETQKVVLYTGTLHKAYGILELLEAFALVPDPDVQLWICGAGEAEGEVKETSLRDPRVRYLGQVSRQEVLSLQRRATVLVNPRLDRGEFTRYSFPSKLLEYLLSGTLAIVRRLPGMPDEYFDHLIVADGDSAASLAAKIVEVCALPPAVRSRRGEAARRFVIEQKNGTTQARRILELIERA